MVNKNRGEIGITLGTKQYIMRPSFQALCSIEGEVEKSMVDMLLNLENNKLKLTEIESIVRNGIAAYEKNPPIESENIGSLICASGIINIMPKIIAFLELAVGIKSEVK